MTIHKRVLRNTVLGIYRNGNLKYAFQCKSTICKPDSNNGPLDGIRVLDFTRILAGPFCTMILGDLGAEIIKVEKLGTGDDTRSWIPPSTNINNQSCYFVAVNRNKKSIALDIKYGQSVVKQLVANCDIIVENFVPGTLDKIGIGYEILSKINPKLIYCSITGYGSSGPYKTRGGYDVIAASLGGLLHITGPSAGMPCKVGVAMTDLATGLYAHGAIMAALIQRNLTGKGQRIDCNLLSTQIACLVNLGSNYLNAGIEAQRWGTAHESIVPYQSFETKDKRWITIGTGSTERFYELCELLDLDQLKYDERFSTNELRVKHREQLISLLSETMLTKTCKEWLQCFDGCKFPYGPVNDFSSAFNDPQVLHNDLVHNLGGFKVVGPPVQYSKGGNYPRSIPPLLGEHTQEILKTVLHLSDAEIDVLYKSKIVQ